MKISVPKVISFVLVLASLWGCKKEEVIQADQSATYLKFADGNALKQAIAEIRKAKDKQVRSYNNLFKRAVRGRNTRANSGSYVALAAEVPFATGDLIDVPNLALAYPVGIKYGLRRAIGRHLYAEGSIGGFLKVSRPQVVGVPRLDAAVAWYW